MGLGKQAKTLNHALTINMAQSDEAAQNIILQVLPIDCDECPKSPINSYNGLLSLAHKENDPIEQNKLIAQQNKLISYISGLGIGVSSSDTVLLKKFKPLS